MRTSVRWLNDYLDRPVTPDEAAARLPYAGLRRAVRLALEACQASMSAAAEG